MIDTLKPVSGLERHVVKGVTFSPIIFTDVELRHDSSIPHGPFNTLATGLYSSRVTYSRQ